MTIRTNTATSLTDDALDGISGGPHISTYHDRTFDYHSDGETAEARPVSKCKVCSVVYDIND